MPFATLPLNTRLKRAATLGLSLAALASAAFGLRHAMRAPMFTLEVGEVTDINDGAPVDAQEVLNLAALPVGKVSLFDLSLDPIEKRILTQPWIKEVRLQKRFPQTLSISVTFREPRALIQNDNGSLAYVDKDGQIFGQVSLAQHSDLPLIAASASGHIQEALNVIRVWELSPLSKKAPISTLQWDSERGFHVLVSYPIEEGRHGRTYVDLGHEIDASVDSENTQFSRLVRVFSYLSAHRLAARQIWADAGKKIVVKTAHGS